MYFMSNLKKNRSDLELEILFPKIDMNVLLQSFDAANNKSSILLVVITVN